MVPEDIPAGFLSAGSAALIFCIIYILNFFRMRAKNYEWDGYGNQRKKQPSECYEVFLQDKIEKRSKEEDNYGSTKDFEEAQKQFLKEVDREWEELQERKKDLEKQNKPTDQSEPITTLGKFKERTKKQSEFKWE